MTKAIFSIEFVLEIFLKKIYRCITAEPAINDAKD